MQSLSSLQGGSDSRNLETTGKLCVLHQFAAPSAEEEDTNPSSKDKPIYVGVSPHSRRLEDDEKEQTKKKGAGWNTEEEKGFKKEQKSGDEVTAESSQQNKYTRTIEDGLLLVVPTKIYGKEVKTLIDSGATRCFVTPSCVTKVGLKGLPRDVFLELGNGQKYLSRGYVPDVPIVTAGLTVKIGLTVTNLLHEVDLVLGMNWLQLVNPVIDWGSGRLYIPNAVHTALLQGDWLEGHVQSGTVTVLSDAKELKFMQDQRMQRQISILKMPKFWTDAAGSSILRTKFNKGHEKNDVEWGYLYNSDCKICKRKNVIQNECKHRNPCKLYVIKHEEDVLRVRRMSVNAKLPVRSSAEAAGYDLSAAQAAVIPAHGKCLVKTGLAISMPSWLLWANSSPVRLSY